jgi:hypothetical protein
LLRLSSGSTAGGSSIRAGALVQFATSCSLKPRPWGPVSTRLQDSRGPPSSRRSSRRQLGSSPLRRQGAFGQPAPRARSEAPLWQRSRTWLVRERNVADRPSREGFSVGLDFEDYLSEQVSRRPRQPAGGGQGREGSGGPPGALQPLARGPVGAGGVGGLGRRGQELPRQRPEV